MIRPSVRNILTVLVSLLAVATAETPAQPKPPQPRKSPHVSMEHGRQRVDEYFWMGDRSDSALIPHLEAENSYTAAMMKPTEALQRKIYDELVARIEQRYVSLPVRRNGYWYSVRYEEGKQYPRYVRRRGVQDAPEETVIDANELARGRQILIVRGWDAAPTGTWLAYGIDTRGDRRSTAYFKDLRSNAVADERVANTSGDYAWSEDGRDVLYVLNDHTVRPYRVMRHRVGTAVTSDAVVYEEKDSTFGVGLTSSRDNRTIFIVSGSTRSTEIRFLPAADPAAVPLVIQPRTVDLLYSVVETEGKDLYLRTNRGALNFKLVRTSMDRPSAEHWVDVIPHRADALFLEAVVLKDFIAAQYLANAVTQVNVTDRRSGASFDLDFGEETYEANISAATDDAAQDSIRFSYSSLTTPQTEYRYDLTTRKKSQLKQDVVGGGFDQSKYEARRLRATAGDGARVPISVVYRKDALRRDGSNPALIYAYGSYGASTLASFNRSVISLLDRGFVYAIAHIRGGQELGRSWYDNGKVLTKKNTFTDFAACADHLVSQQFTRSDRMFANGGSAGGMLMGAVINMRPELFRGVLAEVPWMDVITDSFNTDLPLTTLEFDEWGNPNDPTQYAYLRTWSPYDNVKQAKYPAIFATGGLNDTQVPYYSPAKWVARVRDNNTGNEPVLFKCNMGAGHGGESGRFERQKLTAQKYAFMLQVLGRVHED